jgi:hypothetical protein
LTHPTKAPPRPARLIPSPVHTKPMCNHFSVADDAVWETLEDELLIMATDRAYGVDKVAPELASLLAGGALAAVIGGMPVRGVLALKLHEQPFELSFGFSPGGAVVPKRLVSLF